MVFHLINRGVGPRVLFTKDEDFLAFERVVIVHRGPDFVFGIEDST
jgi:hypothetical protein